MTLQQIRGLKKKLHMVRRKCVYGMPTYNKFSVISQLRFLLQKRIREEIEQPQ